MKISSADVRSLLMRLNDEIQGGTGKPMDGPMSFAQSLGESLVFGGASAPDKKMATAGSAIVAKVASTGDSAVPLSADCGPAVAVSQDEAEIPKLPVGPGNGAALQLKEVKAPDAKAVVSDDVPAEKTDHKTATLSEEPKNKMEAAKNRADHKDRNAGIGSDIPADSKTVAVDPAAQIAPTNMVAIDLPVLQPAASASNDETATKLLPAEIRSSGKSGNPLLPRSTAQGAKTTAATQEGHKSKGLAANADKTDADDAAQATVVGDSRQGFAAEVGEKQLAPAKSDSANPSIHVSSSSLAASSTMPQPMAAAHGVTQTQASSPGDVPHAMQSRSSEPPQTTVQDHRILSATPSTIEVGVASGPHGWLKIRAEMTDTGTVKAAIASSSTTVQEMLHRDLPLLSSFLEQERIPVSSLAVHQTAPSSGIGSASMGSGGATGQSRGESAGNQNQPQQSVTSAKDILVPEGLPDMRLDDLAAISGGGGSWLNVRA